MAATIPTAAAQVGNGRTPHRVRKDGFHVKALCTRTVSREFTPHELAKLGDFCKGCEKAYAALLAETSAEEAPAVEAVEAPITPAPVVDEEAPARTPAVHRFETSSDAYDATQALDGISDGDVIVVESEKVVGFLVQAWPAAITAERGSLHMVSAPDREHEGGAYAASVDLAEQLANELGFDVDPLHATPAVVAEEEAPAQDESTEDMPAGVECVHGFTERPGDSTRPAATCAAKGSAASVGVFGDEGCVDRSDCAVQASEAVHRLNAEHDAECWWAVTCPAHEEEPATCCEECATDEDDEPGDDVQDDVYGDEPDDADQGEQAPADAAPEQPAQEAESVPATFAEGDRVLCVDGLVRTARYTETKDGKVWIVMKDRSAWPVKSSELIDTSRVETATADALRAAETLRATAAAPDPAALAELGDALRYLRHADPAAHAALIEGADRIAVRIPRADLAPGDVLHDQGPHDVLDVCTVAMDTDAPRWWARILGHTKEVRAYTGRKPWPAALSLDLARTDEVSVDRPLPGISPMPAPFAEGDRIVCADGTAHTVRAMSPIVRDEPARVVVEDGTEWIAENCRRANSDDVDAARAASARAAVRVRTNPNPTDPEWEAALDELATALDFLKIVDPVTRAALIKDEAVAAVHAIHAEAHDFQPFARPGHPATAGWSFRTGHGVSARYGIVTTDVKVSPVGLYEYRTTAERAYLYADRRFTAAPVTG